MVPLFFSFLLTVFSFFSFFNSSDLCQDEYSGIRIGKFSYYEQSPTDGTIHWHQTVDEALPLDMSSYAGVVAVQDCSLVGRDAWVRVIEPEASTNDWLPVKVFDCSGHEETTQWMRANNFLGELGYYLVNDLDMYARFNIQGEIAFEHPIEAAKCGYVDMYDVADVLHAQDYFYYGGTVDEDPEQFMISQATVPELLTALPILEVTITPTATATGTPVPTMTPAPTVTPVIPTIVPTEEIIPTPWPTPTISRFIDVAPIVEAEDRIAAWAAAIIVTLFILMAVQLYIVLRIIKWRWDLSEVVKENTRLRSLLVDLEGYGHEQNDSG